MRSKHEQTIPLYHIFKIKLKTESLFQSVDMNLHINSSFIPLFEKEFFNIVKEVWAGFFFQVNNISQYSIRKHYDSFW